MMNERDHHHFAHNHLTIHENLSAEITLLKKPTNSLTEYNICLVFKVLWFDPTYKSRMHDCTVNIVIVAMR